MLSISEPRPSERSYQKVRHAIPAIEWPAFADDIDAIVALKERRNAVILDVREPKEYEGGRIPNAVHLPQSQLESRGHELKKLTTRPVIAYCGRGQRSRTAAGVLTKVGFAEVYSLRGGLRAWSEAGLPVEKGA